ncbi:hypothetical protein D041_3872B, partial [Vibrio parahaemolyticus EKP-008]
ARFVERIHLRDRSIFFFQL